jgi:hypothetical protein
MTTSSRKPPARRAAKPKPTFADIRAKIQRPRRITELVMDAAAAAEIEQLEDLLERAQRHDENNAGGPETAPGVAKRLQEVEQSADDSRVPFVLEAISHRAYQALRGEHPPTKEQAEEAADKNDVAPFDPDTFAPALVHAQLIEPQAADLDEFMAFWDALSDGQMRQLWTTALAVQMQVTELGPRSQSAIDVLRSFSLTTE